ncbi:retrovirus-related pol polyprotein from transposon TNT 1-94 [Tanacetum coccineum]
MFPSSSNSLADVQLSYSWLTLGCIKHHDGHLKLLYLIQGNVMIKRVYYVEGLNHNLFSVGQFCDADLEAYLTLKYVMDINFCSSCEISKAKRSSFKSKAVPSSKGRLNLLHMDLCGPMRDETPEVLKDFLTMIQRNLQAQVITVRTDRGTEFLNKTLHAYFKEEGIEHQTSTPRTPEQNGIVERRNRTLVEAARTMLSASKLPLSFWAEAVATVHTQNRSIIISTHGKTAYHIINDRKPSIKHLHIFGCICYITRDGENLDKMKEKGDPCVMVGYSTQSKGYRVYNKRTRLIVESIHIKFDEIKEMMLITNSSGTSHHNVKRCLLKMSCVSSPFVEFDLLPWSRAFGQNLHDYRWTRDHPLEQVRGNPTMLVQTRRQLAADPEMCMFALTVSIVEPKNIKEAMADSAWIEAMQDELHQFNRLKV